MKKMFPILVIAFLLGGGYVVYADLKVTIFFWVCYFLIEVLALVLLYSNAKQRVNLVLTLVSTMVALFSVNAMLAFTKIDNPYLREWKHRIKKAEQLGIPFDSRTLAEVIDDYKKEGKDLNDGVFPQLTLPMNPPFLPLGGISGVWTTRGNESGVWHLYKSDKYGFSNTPDAYDFDILDAVVIGDSFVQGAAVSVDEDICSVLRKKGFSTVSLGISGNGPLVELGTLKEYAVALSPRFVFWGFFEGNDFRNLTYEKDNGILMSYLKDPSFSQDLVNRQEEIDTFLENFRLMAGEKKDSKWIGDLLLLRSLRGKIHLPFFKQEKFVVDEDGCRKVFEATILEAKAATEAWGGQFVFVYMPAYSRFAEEKASFFVDRKEYVMSFLKENDIAVLDITKVFIKHGTPLELFPFGMHGHYNATGYRLFAEFVADYIQANPGILP